MNKIFIIIKREYLTRVRKRSFIILTLLIPFIFVGFAAIVGGIATSKSERKNIVVVDDSHLFDQKLKSSDNVAYTFMNGNADSVKRTLDLDKYDGLLHIPVFNQNAENLNFKLFYSEELGIGAQKTVENDLNKVLTDKRMQTAGVSDAQLKFLQSESISISLKNIENGKDSSNERSMAIGFGCGLLLYMFMLFYGMSVMRSVMEEKTNRIAEIIVSSVKPFQLMMGKIIGVALVGLTQVVIWIALFTVVAMVGLPMMTGGMAMQSAMDPDSVQHLSHNAAAFSKIQDMMQGVSWINISLWFLFYFLGGYFLYAALFASVGSLVNEDPQESGQYTLPITLPIILGFVIMQAAMQDPNSPLAIFGSLFPLTSPIVMMARIPFGVPWQQEVLSAVLLILGFMGTTWMAGKIYRTGILMYGKKITLKEVGKWLVRKN